MPHLQEHQYKNSTKFNARISLYKFGTNKYPWPLWVFDNFRKEKDLRVLEIGCGNGLLWILNADRVPPGWNITLSDFSEGMLNDTKKNIGDRVKNISYEVINAENIPHENSTYDIVIANHMLYHIPDRKKAISEIHRVLKDDGIFYATTMRGDYMIEMKVLIRDYKSGPHQEIKTNTVISNFSIENGEGQLKEAFREVELKIYENLLVINEIEPLIDYAYSLNGMHSGKAALHESEREAFMQFIKSRIFTNGRYTAPSDFGLFMSKK